MTGEEALAFVRLHGVVLASGKGPVPNVVEAIANEPIKGSWWGHPQGREIFRILQQLRVSREILVCRLVEGKVTFVHRRLWPAVVRVAEHFPTQRLAQVHEEHTVAGHHVTRDVSFPNWVPPEVVTAAHKLDERQALNELGWWATQKRAVHKRARPKKTLVKG
jgi:hypothetical protein